MKKNLANSSVVILIACAIAYLFTVSQPRVDAQLPSQIELPCSTTSGGIVSTPMQATGQTFNAATGKYRQWECVDPFGNVYIAASVTSGGGTPVATVASVDLSAQQASIGPTTLLTPSANGFYRASCYLVITQAATTSSTLPQCNVLFTDADSSTAQTNFISSTSTSNTVGQQSLVNATVPAYSFYAKSGISIRYSTTSYASSGVTPMQYSLHFRLEGPF